MTTMEEMERRMKEMGEEIERLAVVLDETNTQLKAVSLAVMKLKENVRYMQDQVI